VNAAKFYIYRNLHTGGFSIKLRGRVVDRDNFFIGENVTFKVNELGRQRVIREKRKNVHAYSVAERYTFADRRDADLVDSLPVITYNPYTAAYFTCNGAPITYARRILFHRGKCYLIDK
jgi:hypothetical protein